MRCFHNFVCAMTFHNAKHFPFFFINIKYISQLLLLNEPVEIYGTEHGMKNGMLTCHNCY